MKTVLERITPYTFISHTNLSIVSGKVDPRIRLLESLHIKQNSHSFSQDIRLAKYEFKHAGRNTNSDVEKNQESPQTELRRLGKQHTIG